MSLSANVGERMSKTSSVKRRFAGLVTVLVAASFSFECYAGCREGSLVADNAYFAAMGKQMAAAHGVRMEKVAQKILFHGDKITMTIYSFGKAVEVRDSSGGRKVVLVQSDYSADSIGRASSLAAATVSYFTKEKIDESQVRVQIDEMIKKGLAAEPTKEEVSKPGWTLPLQPVAKSQWGDIEASVKPAMLDSVSVLIRRISCR